MNIDPCGVRKSGGEGPRSTPKNGYPKHRLEMPRSAARGREQTRRTCQLHDNVVRGGAGLVCEQ
jgi:hypothetical protein